MKILLKLYTPGLARTVTRTLCGRITPSHANFEGDKSREDDGGIFRNLGAISFATITIRLLGAAHLCTNTKWAPIRSAAPTTSWDDSFGYAAGEKHPVFSFSLSASHSPLSSTTFIHFIKQFCCFLVQYTLVKIYP